MKLTGQHKQVYDYLKENGRATIREIRDNTFPSVQKPCMRCSEINQQYQEMNGENPIDLKDDTKNLIVNAGKNKREVYKAIRVPLTKQTSTYHYDEERGVMVEKVEQVAV